MIVLLKIVHGWNGIGGIMDIPREYIGCGELRVVLILLMASSSGFVSKKNPKMRKLKTKISLH
jgi:putative transposon-encoded protein